MKILIVEDNEDNRTLLVKQLRAYGHEVMAAADGVEALQQALGETPDIVISDIMMPKMDGYQLCQECKQNDKLRDIPFVFYTATYTKEEDEKLGLSLGANSFIYKPTGPDVLVQMLSEIVEKAKSGALAPPKAPLESSLFLSEYTKRIVAKLEDKVVELEAEITARKKTEEERSRLYEEVKTLNLELEEKVKERTKELEETVQAAEVANRAKSDFLAGMSHELRTPLNAVIGFSQVLQEQYFGKLNEKQVEYVTDILESGQHLLSLINDILDLAKIEAGKMELELSKVIIKDLLGSSLIMIKEKALAHGISLDIDTTGDLEGLEIMADERRLKQVMFNLLSNAAKFTPDGGAIRVESWKEGKELIISVSDTGIGIASEEQEKIFEEFYQATGGIRDKTPGTGLGLPLTRSIVEMHGGRIWVESEGRGKGSRFTFTLPI